MATKVEWITCPRGDWTTVLVDGKLFADGHSISEWSILELLRRLGAEVVEREVSDEAMETGEY